MSDIYDEKAAGLLPCTCQRGADWDDNDHNLACKVWDRPAVAAALRKQGEIIDTLRRNCIEPYAKKGEHQ